MKDKLTIKKIKQMIKDSLKTDENAYYRLGFINIRLYALNDDDKRIDFADKDLKKFNRAGYTMSDVLIENICDSRTLCLSPSARWMEENKADFDLSMAHLCEVSINFKKDEDLTRKQMIMLQKEEIKGKIEELEKQIKRDFEDIEEREKDIKKLYECVRQMED